MICFMTNVAIVRCGICDVDIFKMYRGTLTEKQLEVKLQHIPDQILYNGKKRKTCVSCYTTLEGGLVIYRDREYIKFWPDPLRLRTKFLKEEADVWFKDLMIKTHKKYKDEMYDY